LSSEGIEFGLIRGEFGSECREIPVAVRHTLPDKITKSNIQISNKFQFTIINNPNTGFPALRLLGI